MVVTSPNQDWIPEYPMERSIIQTFSDGLWGVREYSRWPQELVHGMWHIACIPRRGSAVGLPSVLWHRLNPDEDWYEDPRAGLQHVGFIRTSLVEPLRSAAESMLNSYRSVPKHERGRCVLGEQICMLLDQSIERMTRLPARPSVAVAVAAHVQRLTLELAGLKLYLDVVTRRIETAGNFSTELLDVLGAFVKDGTAAQTLTRVGLPVWFLQPLTPHIKIWRVVFPCPVLDLSNSASETAILHAPHVRAGVMNLTGNWLATMVQGVSMQLCSITLPTLFGAGGDEPGEGDRAKRPRPLPSTLRSKTIELPTIASQSRASVPPTPGPSVRSDAVLRPSQHHIASPFYDLPIWWERALRLAGTLPQPPKSAVYFYPPPFLLDTVSSLDEKVHRYLHNLLRIRHFCRLRLFDATISGHPLSIAEWRAALWGDYFFKADPVVNKSEGHQRRAKRRFDDRNAVARLFGNVAAMKPYCDTDTPYLGGLTVTSEVAARDARVRYHLLWEAHETNWRCELLALDQAVVSREGWPIMERWEREAEVSAVWGEGSGVLGVLPRLPQDQERFLWSVPPDPDWKKGLQALRALLRLMSRWPEYPETLRSMPTLDEDWTSDDYDEAQRCAVSFYTTTFVRCFHRLPIPPIAFPEDYHL
ncbi:hypothetical protein C8Q70DRAFT_920361 [Cubamyces menziesii]|nr:hypothetical protein C8Q70DRAFT_920361 [Cubamyces menziesii]